MDILPRNRIAFVVFPTPSKPFGDLSSGVYVEEYHGARVETAIREKLALARLNGRRVRMLQYVWTTDVTDVGVDLETGEFLPFPLEP